MFGDLHRSSLKCDLDAVLHGPDQTVRFKSLGMDSSYVKRLQEFGHRGYNVGIAPRGQRF